ncbi:helix-turn-helix domain-containing protein [Micromonospora zingiberis]|uniref:helix-turn-helix domain-containing protein n=1 Tax=Micromonospora zingiberis TaxID=2053011 RepID=UPI001981FBD7|nr:helix-turn-helix transcriptional regulator [Micromonospora zingiberis]
MPPHPPDPLSGPLLTRLRLARGWSQSRLAAELCAAAGVPTLSRHEVSRWERQRRIPGRFWHAWLATVLDPPACSPEGLSTDPPAAPAVASPIDPPAGRAADPATEPPADLTAGPVAGGRGRRAGRCRPAPARPPVRRTGRATTRRDAGGSARRDLTH